MPAYKKEKKEPQKIVVHDNEKRVRELCPKCVVLEEGRKISILAKREGKVLSTDKNIDNAWKKALHSLL